MTDQPTHEDIKERIDRLEEKNSHSHELLFDKINVLRINNNRWLFWLIGAMVSTLMAIVGANVNTHTRILDQLGAQSVKIHVLETKKVPPPEVLQRFHHLENDAQNRERQLDNHVKERAHAGHKHED